ncbi:MAG: methyltransferase domain-containing protein [Promethearchaeota archaeon]
MNKILTSLNNRLVKTNKSPLSAFLSVEEIRDVAIDNRPRTMGICSILQTTLDEIIDKERFQGARVLEIGPKYGYHSKWIDSNLKPSKLVLLELPEKDGFAKKWISELKYPHEIIYESIFSCKKLINEEKFDLIFCTGVLYHTVEHFKLLNILRRLLKDNGLMLFQTTIAIYIEDLILISWNHPNQKGGYLYPSKSALIKMLAMTGWDNIRIFTKFRPKSNSILLTCQKSKELYLSYDGLPFGGSNF